MDLLTRIKHLKRPDLTDFIQVMIGPEAVGWTKRSFAAQISDFDDTWSLKNDTLILSERLADFNNRTKAIDATFMAMSAKGLLPVMPDYSALGGIDWFGISTDFSQKPLAAVKRFYASYLGIKNESVFLNGYKSDGYWVAKRSQFVDDAKGQLDILVAGAIDYRDSVLDSLAEEADKEAGLTERDLNKAKKIGVLKHHYLNARGFLLSENFHVFDLEMGDDILPVTKLPREVEDFQLLPLTRDTKLIEDNDFKFELTIVLVDFLIRHGYINENDPGFNEIKQLIDEDRNVQEFVR